MGLSSVGDVHERLLMQNKHMRVLDHATRARYHSYTDVNLVGQQYKQGRYYYSTSMIVAATPPSDKTQLVIVTSPHYTVIKSLLVRIFVVVV